MAQSGALNVSDLFALNSGHTTVVQVDTNTLLPTSTAASAKSHRVERLDKSFGITRDVTANAQGRKYTWDQEKGGDRLLRVIETYVGTEEQEAATEYYADSVAADAIESAAGTNDLLHIFYMTADVDDPAKIMVEFTVGNFSGDSGSTSHKKGERIKPTAVFNSKKSKAEFTIDKDLLDETIVTIPGSDLTFPAGKQFYRVLITKAA